MDFERLGAGIGMGCECVEHGCLLCQNSNSVMGSGSDSFGTSKTVKKIQYSPRPPRDAGFIDLGVGARHMDSDLDEKKSSGDILNPARPNGYNGWGTTDQRKHARITIRDREFQRKILEKRGLGTNGKVGDKAGSGGMIKGSQSKRQVNSGFSEMLQGGSFALNDTVGSSEWDEIGYRYNNACRGSGAMNRTQDEV
jgi:hypothetical protein